MEQENGKIIEGEIHYPSHFGEVYDAMPEKFEKRKNLVKPIIYWGLTAVCVLLVIFPGWLPFINPWIIRVAGIIGAIICGLTAYAADLCICNRTSGGEVKHYKTKKFISSMTDRDDIVAAFNRHDFEYLCSLPSGNDQPVQLQVEKDEKGHELYCILVTYTKGYKIVGLADDIKLNLAAADIRIEAPIPGKAAVGIEVPNKENTAVMLRDLLETDEF